MSKRVTTIQLDVPVDRALDLCQSALKGPGWELREIDAEHVTWRQDITFLSCMESPATVDLQLGPSDSGATLLRVETRVPGFGPLTSRHLDRRAAFVYRRLAGAVADA